MPNHFPSSDRRPQLCAAGTLYLDRRYFGGQAFGVMRYAASLPSPLRSIQPFPSSFDINFGLSGKLIARRHAVAQIP
jgi:hypothetical protein